MGTLADRRRPRPLEGRHGALGDTGEDRRSGDPREAADAAGTAYSAHFETPSIVLTKTPTSALTLQLPAGSYVLMAKAQVDTNTTSDIVECDIVAGTATDKSFVQGSASHASQIITNSLVYSSRTAGTASLACAGVFGSTSALSQARITAIQVESVDSTTCGAAHVGVKTPTVNAGRSTAFRCAGRGTIRIETPSPSQAGIVRLSRSRG